MQETTNYNVHREHLVPAWPNAYSKQAMVANSGSDGNRQRVLVRSTSTDGAPLILVRYV